MKMKSQVALAAVAMLFAGAASAAGPMTPGALEQYVRETFPYGIAKTQMVSGTAARVEPRFGADGKTIVRTSVCVLPDGESHVLWCGFLAGDDKRIKPGDRANVADFPVLDASYRARMARYIEAASVTNARGAPAH